MNVRIVKLVMIYDIFVPPAHLHIIMEIILSSCCWSSPFLPPTITRFLLVQISAGCQHWATIGQLL